MRTVAPDGAITLSLTGTVTAAATADIERALAAAGGPDSCVLDLSRVRLIDRPMLQYLGDAMRHAVRVVNCPDHIAGWLARTRASDEEDSA